MKFFINDLDISEWKDDASDGFWFGVGFGHKDTHADFIMCEYFHRIPSKEEDYFCYDRFWDGHEFYDDDTDTHGAFIIDQKRRFFNSNKGLNLEITFVKNFKNKFGSHDFTIIDGSEVELILLYGDMFLGEPYFKKSHYKRIEQTIQLENLQEVMDREMGDL